MTQQIKRLFEKVFRRFSLILSTAKILVAKKEGVKVQFAEDEIKDGIKIVAPYGFHSIPKKGAVCLVASNGDRNTSYIIAGSSESIRDKSSTSEGVVELLDGSGASISLLDGVVKIKCNSFVLHNTTDDLVKLNKDLLEALLILVGPGSSNSGGPVVFNPAVRPILDALKIKWG